MLQQHKLYILNNYGIRNMKRDVWGVGRVVKDVGPPRIVDIFPSCA
jgi:hypothetical protein